MKAEPWVTRRWRPSDNESRTVGDQEMTSQWQWKQNRGWPGDDVPVTMKAEPIKTTDTRQIKDTEADTDTETERGSCWQLMKTKRTPGDGWVTRRWRPSDRLVPRGSDCHLIPDYVANSIRRLVDRRGLNWRGFGPLGTPPTTRITVRRLHTTLEKGPSGDSSLSIWFGRKGRGGGGVEGGWGVAGREEGAEKRCSERGYWYNCGSSLAPKHPRKHETHPPLVKKKKKRVPSRFKRSWFYLCWRKLCWHINDTPSFIWVVCNKLTTVWAPTKKTAR